MQIEFNLDHQNKLVEMCKFLFPDNNWCISDQKGSCGNHCSPHNANYIYQGTNPYSFPVSITHWYEFCNTRLIHKLQEELAKKKTTDKNIWDEYWFSLDDYFNTTYIYSNDIWVHPVDYLYNKFKALINE
jgi:hypothetical protein